MRVMRRRFYRRTLAWQEGQERSQLQEAGQGRGGGRGLRANDGRGRREAGRGDCRGCGAPQRGTCERRITGEAPSKRKVLYNIRYSRRDSVLEIVCVDP